MATGTQSTDYTGTANLEAMEEAVRYNRYLLGLIRSVAPASGPIIDFGAGTGTFADLMTRRGHDVTAVEPDGVLRGRLAGRCRAVAADIAEVAAGSHAYAYSLNVLEHIEDDTAAVRAVHAALAPGARFAIYVPAFPSLYSRMDAKVGHVRRYTRSRLIQAIVGGGFALESIRFVDSLGYPASLALKLLDRGSGDISPTAVRLYDSYFFPLSLVFDTLCRRWVGKNLFAVARKS